MGYFEARDPLDVLGEAFGIAGGQSGRAPQPGDTPVKESRFFEVNLAGLSGSAGVMPCGRDAIRWPRRATRRRPR